jgi:hypothetical protein
MKNPYFVASEISLKLKFAANLALILSNHSPANCADYPVCIRVVTDRGCLLEIWWHVAEIAARFRNYDRQNKRYPVIPVLADPG